MRQPVPFVLLSLLALGACAPFLPASQAAQPQHTKPTGYRVVKTISLPTAGTTLELLIDTTLKPDTDDEAAYDKKLAILRVVRADGRVVQELPLERSRATLTPVVLQGTQMVYQITVDYSVGAGSYNGPITFWLEMVKGRLRYVSVDGKRINVMSSLKTDWKLVPSPGGRGKDILEVACRPSPTIGDSSGTSDKDFQIIYTRFSYNGNSWKRKTAKHYGFWESDGTFPPLSRFPR